MKFEIIFLNKISIIQFYITALHKAVQNRNNEIIKLLLDQPNVNVNVEDEIFILYK